MAVKYEKIETVSNDLTVYIKTGYINSKDSKTLYIVGHGYWGNDDNKPKTFSDVPNNYKTTDIGYVKNDTINFFKDIKPVIPLYYFNFGRIIHNTIETDKNSIVIDVLNEIITKLKTEYSTLTESDINNLELNNLTIIDCDETFNYLLEDDIEHKHSDSYKDKLNLLNSLSKTLSYHQLDNVTESLLDITNNPGYTYIVSLLNYMKRKNVEIFDFFYRNEVKVWNITEKPDPLLRFKNLFFMPLGNKEDYISVMEYKKDGGKKDDDDDPSSNFPVGRKTSKACFGVIKLKLPKLITDAMDAYTYNNNHAILSAIDLTNLYHPDNIRNGYTMGLNSYYRDRDYVLRDMSNSEIVFPILPSGLATKLYNQMDILYMIIDKYEKKIFDTYVKFQDITESFFKDKTCIVPNGISEWLVKDCNIGTHKRDIHIELGKDMLTRNNLKAIEKDEPKVYMVTHSSKEGVEDKNCIISYYILIETKTGIGVYCNFFTSKVIL